MGFPGDSMVKNLPAEQKMGVLSLGWEDLPEKGTDYLLQLSGLISKSRTRLSNFHFHFTFTVFLPGKSHG